MQKTENKALAMGFAEMIRVESAYPLSVAEETQTGEIFVDDITDPKTALFWHYCGFAGIAGEPDGEFLSDVLRLMHSPTQGHSGRLALHTEKNAAIHDFLCSDAHVRIGERYVFRFSNTDISTHRLGAGYELRTVDADNYELISGCIVPGFSWESKEQFIKNGFGVCVVKEGRAVACAFSSAVTGKSVDIGVETAEEARGHGLGKAVACAMIEETLRRGKTPLWGCDVKNEASKRLALSVGFETVGTHPWYVV